MANALLADVGSSELVRRCLGLSDYDDDYWTLIRELHHRAGSEELALGLALLDGESWARVVGCQLLAQLGYETRIATGSWPHRDASLPAVRRLFADPEAHVRSEAVRAVGFLGLDGFVAEVVTLSSDVSAQVRESVALTLGGREDDESILALVALSADPDDEVRNWATFHIGMGERDDELVRGALVTRLEDPRRKIRGEALVGLALRGDSRGLGPLMALLSSDDVWGVELEAAEAYADPRLLSDLRWLRAGVASSDTSYWVGQLDRAIEACSR